MRPPAAVIERADAAIFVAIENLVARLPRDAELGAQRRHLFALEQAGHKPEPLVHDVTLLPRHAPSCGGQSVTHPLGICCYLTLRKDRGILFGEVEWLATANHSKPRPTTPARQV